MNLLEAEKKNAVEEAQRIINEANPYLVLPEEEELGEIMEPGTLIDVLRDLKPSSNLVRVAAGGLVVGVIWASMSGQNNDFNLADLFRSGACGLSGMLVSTFHYGLYYTVLSPGLGIG